MQQRRLGSQGLEVSQLGLGCMSMSEFYGPRDDAESVATLHRALDLGVTFFDTANAYGPYLNEGLVGRALGDRRDRVVLATKFGIHRSPAGEWLGVKGSPDYVRECCDASLLRLGTDHIDLYWVHFHDAFTPVEETMRGLDDLVRAGKVLYVGISDAPAWIVARANTLAELRGWTAFIGLQVQWSLLDRDVERELVPMAQAFDLGITPWGVLGAGLLTGKYADGKAPEDTRRAGWTANRLTEKNFAIAAEVQKVAAEIERTPSQVAIAWVRQKSPVVIPIIGARKHEQLLDNLKAADLQLAPEHMQRLDAVSAIQLGFPHDFLNSDSIRSIAYGGTFSRIDDHRRR